MIIAILIFIGTVISFGWISSPLLGLIILLVPIYFGYGVSVGSALIFTMFIKTTLYYIRDRKDPSADECQNFVHASGIDHYINDYTWLEKLFAYNKDKKERIQMPPDTASKADAPASPLKTAKWWYGDNNTIETYKEYLADFKPEHQMVLFFTPHACFCNPVILYSLNKHYKVTVQHVFWKNRFWSQKHEFLVTWEKLNHE